MMSTVRVAAWRPAAQLLPALYPSARYKSRLFVSRDDSNDSKHTGRVPALSKLNPVQQWGLVVSQWGIYTGIVGGTSALIAAAGQSGILGMTSDGGLLAAEAFPLIVVGSTLFNFALNTALGGGARLAQSMGGSESNDRTLNRMVAGVYSSAGLAGPAPTVYIIPTQEPNAFAAGTGTRRVVALTTGLLDLLDPREVQAVVAHEIGHIKNDDVSRALQMASMLAGLSSAWTLGDHFLKSARYRELYHKNQSREESSSSALGATIGLALYVAGLTTYLSGTLLRLASSRKTEFAADAASAEVIGSGKPLASALIKLQRTHGRPRDVLNAARCSYAHMYIDNPPSRQPLESVLGLFHTHPSTEERVKRLLARD